MFKVGMAYRTVQNGREREFVIIEKSWEHKEPEFVIRWDDGDEEVAYTDDLKRWVVISGS